MKKRKGFDIGILYTIPLDLVMVIPLVVYGKLVKTGLSEFPWYADRTDVLDLFLYYKQSSVLVVSCLMLSFMTIMIARGYFIGRFSIFVPFGIYVALAFLSSFASPYRDYALKGMMEQFENIWVIAGYFLICVYAYLICGRNFFAVFGIFCGVVGAIGTLQYFGIDIYRTELFQKLCMPQGLQQITFHITVERGRSYCSLSNPNYVGVLCCLTIPVLTVLTFCAKRWCEQILFGVSDLLMLCSLIGSRSKSGALVLTVCMGFASVSFRKQIAEKFRWSSRKTTAVLWIIMFCVSAAAGLSVRQWGDFSYRDNISDTRISEITTNDSDVKIVYDDKVLFFSIDYKCFSLVDAVNIVDEKGRSYSTTEHQGVLYFDDEALSDWTVALVRYGDYIALEIGDGKLNWYFTDQTGDCTWYYLTYYGKPDKLISDTVAVYKRLEGRERIVSGRGYIWSRTIPLLNEHFFLGSGQDSFAVVFPNNDYLGMAKWGYKNMLITKPHSMYLQIAVQSGLLSLALLMIFWIRFFKKTILNSSKDTQAILAKAIAVGVLGYLLMGMTNDSNIGIAPIFWMLIGIGLRLSESQNGSSSF